MKTIEYTAIDKSDWPDGPWKDEPDKRQWLDEATGLPCLIVRGPMGALCGYVGVSRGHPAYNKDYGAIEADVHGGLTFSGFCSKGPEETSICHVVEDGEDDKVFWLGFDCAHLSDAMPRMESSLGLQYSAYPRAYRDFAYVEGECKHLARQLAAMR